jgi:hypothetical protein
MKELDVNEISKSDFIAYETIRQSGITNMFDVAFVSEISGLTREKIFTIMKHYEKLRDKYLTKGVKDAIELTLKDVRRRNKKEEE